MPTLNPVPLPVSEADGVNVALGATTDAAAVGDSSNVGMVALFKRGLARLTTLLGLVPAALVGGAFSIVPVDASASATITATNANTVGPSAATAGSTAQITLNADGLVSIDVRGTYTGALTPQVSTNGLDWVTMPGNPVFSTSAGTYAGTITTGAVGLFRVEVGSYAFFRVSANAAVTGSATVTLRASDAATVAGSNVQLFGGVALSTGAGAGGAGVPRVTLSNDAYAADAAAATGNPVRVGGIVKIVSSNYGGNSAASLIMTRSGQTLTKPYGLPDLDWAFASAVVTASGNVTVNAAAGASVRNYCTGLQYQNTNGTATEITITDGNAGTVLWRGYAAANMALAQDVEFATPLQGTANTLLALNVATGSANLYFNAQGYKGA